MDQSLITIVGVIITAVVTWSIAQRRIAVENVTKERARWRQQIRWLASQIYEELSEENSSNAKIDKLKMKLRVLLDPCDKRDQKILDYITKKSIENFITEVTLLLKYDWERSKLEAGFFLCRWFFCVKRLKKCDVEDGEITWCDKYKIKWIPSILTLILLTIFMIIMIKCIEIPCLCPYT